MAEDEIDRAKSEVELAKNRLLRVYIASIVNNYDTADEEQRGRILYGLENLVKPGSNGLEQLTAVKNRVRRKNASLFDKNKAAQIRIDAGLTKNDLARELNPKGVNTTVSLLWQYESGYRNPRGIRGEIARKYLLWLKEKGYNPYKL